MSAGIYRITNLVTNEIYIGYASNLRKRFLNYRGIQIKGQPLIFNSIKSHGFENHSFDILFEYQDHKPTIFELKQIEGIYIRYYKYWKKSSMLNSNDGGGGCRAWSKEKKEKKSIEMTGTGSKSILQYGIDGKFLRKWNSISEASNSLNLDYNLLIRCLKGKFNSKIVGGYQWKYAEHITINHNTKNLGQYDLNDNLIKTWVNPKEFLRSIGKTDSNGQYIYYCCNGKINYKSAYGFKWKLLDGDFTTIDEDIKDIDAFNLAKHRGCKEILQYDSDGNFIKEWTSIIEPSKTLKIPISQINAHLYSRMPKLINKTDFKFQWKYKNGSEILLKIDPISYPAIAQYTLSGEFVKLWKTTKEISNEFNVTVHRINQFFHRDGEILLGYRWLRCKSGEYLNKIEFQYDKNIILNSHRLNDSSIFQYSLHGDFIKKWESIYDASEKLKCAYYTLRKCIDGKIKISGGFQWRKEFFEKIEAERIIQQFDLNGNLINEWERLKTIKLNGFKSIGGISRCLSNKRESALGYMWKYKKNNLQLT